MKYKKNDAFYLSAFVAVAIFATIVFAFSSIWHVEKNLKQLAIRQGAFTTETLLKNFISVFTDRNAFEELIYNRIVKTAELIKGSMRNGKIGKQLKFAIDRGIIDEAIYTSESGKQYIIAKGYYMKRFSYLHPMLFFIYQNRLNTVLSKLKRGKYIIIGKQLFSKMAVSPITYVEHLAAGGYLLITSNPKKLKTLSFKSALNLIFDKLKSDRRINNILFFSIDGNLIKRLRNAKFPNEDLKAPYSLIKIGGFYHLVSYNIVRLNNKIVGYMGIDLKEIELSKVIKLEKLYTVIISLMLIIAATIIIVVIYVLRKKNIDEVIGLKEDIERMSRSEALDSLAASLAHEIRNPLNAISLMVQAASKRKELPKGNAMLIKEEINRLNKLVTDFLSFSKIKVIKKEAIALSKFLDDTADIFRVSAGEQEIEIITNAPDYNVMIDKNLTRQAIENLILNAIEASNRKSRIVLSGKVASKEVVITVTDDGAGMDEHTISHALDPYFTTKQSGTGLGLPAVSKIVYILGGSMHIDSKLDKGTTITMRIPQ